MQIRVEEIPETGLVKTGVWKENRLNQFQPPNDPVHIELMEPVTFSVEIHKRSNHIEITGTLKLIAQLNCHRCLEPYPWSLDHQFHAVLVDYRSVDKAEEVELDPEDMEYEFFDGRVIDIDLLIAEEIFLALPFQTLCSEDCKGLCPHCGANLNRERCSCSKHRIDSPFAKLGILRSQLT